MIGELLKTKKALIGMVHLPALPGAPCYRGASVEEIMSQVCRDRDALIDAGFDALSFSNEGDAPFLSQAPVETVALMSRLIHEASQGLDVPFGCGFLVDAKATLALARAVGADFVRVSFGVTAGMFGFSDSPAGPLLRYQKEIGAEDVALLINVSAHFATNLDTRPFTEIVQNYVELVHPAGVQVHGAGAGRAPTLAEVKAVKDAVGDVAVLVSSGTTAETIASYLRHCDGAIVGTSLKYGADITAPIDPERAKRYVEEARTAR